VHEKAAQQQVQHKIETLGRAIGDLKKTADKFADQVPALEEKVLYELKEFCTKELSFERTTKASENYRS
jgi:hypothetical protein